MPVDITIRIAGKAIAAELNDTETARAIVDKLPLEAEFSTWGDEIYFSIPVETGLDNPREVVEIGEIGYWPPGKAFCIFYGATPGSTEDRILPASPVNSIGRVLDDPKKFKRLAEKSNKIQIKRSE